MKHTLFLFAAACYADMISPVNVRPVAIGATWDAAAYCFDLGATDCELVSVLQALSVDIQQEPHGMWASTTGEITVRLLAEKTAGENLQWMGIWSDGDMDTATTADRTFRTIFNGPDARGSEATLDLALLGINPQAFGFYLSTPISDRAWFTSDVLNDGMAQALAFRGPNDGLVIGFEDLPLSLGDYDYNDAIFSVRGANPVPEPGTLVLLGTVLAAVAFRLRHTRC